MCDLLPFTPYRWFNFILLSSTWVTSSDYIPLIAIKSSLYTPLSPRLLHQALLLAMWNPSSPAPAFTSTERHPPTYKCIPSSLHVFVFYSASTRRHDLGVESIPPRSRFIDTRYRLHALPNGVFHGASLSSLNSIRLSWRILPAMGLSCGVMLGGIMVCPFSHPQVAHTVTLDLLHFLDDWWKYQMIKREEVGVPLLFCVLPWSDLKSKK